MSFSNKRRFIFFACACILMAGDNGFAQKKIEAAIPMPEEKELKNIDIIPSSSEVVEKYQIDEENPTHPALNISPDKSTLIHLPEKAATVIAGNPNHLSILPATGDGLILVGRMPGATYFTVLNNKNEIIMQRHVIIAGPKEKYVRIRKSCAASDDEGCQPTQVYYCPDTCHEIILNTVENGDGSTEEILPPTDNQQNANSGTTE